MTNLLARILKASAIAAALTAAVPASADYAGTVIVSGLNNPRGLEFGPDGGLYIAEAGFLSLGGPTTVIRGNTFNYAETGSITRYLNGAQQRVVTGLPSIASATSAETTGPSDIAFGPGGVGYVLVGLGTSPAVRTTDLAPGGAKLGQLYSFTNAGATAAIADLSAYELGFNPVGGPLDSNPFHLVPNGSGFLVTDAGSNTLLNVASGGAVSLIAGFPGRDIGGGFPSDSVSTGIAIGPDGNYYVAELTGFPFTPGAARIYRVTPGGVVTVAYTGFTMLSDIAFGADGSLYALELDIDGLAQPGVGGALIRIAPNGARETIFSKGLITPTGLAIGPDGAAYVANYSAAAGRGEVLRIAAVPEAATWAMLILGFAAIGVAARRRPQPIRLA